MKLHILAIGVHPDDVELGCGGLLLKHALKGQKTGILDLTQGEMGTRGTIDTRYAEAEAAARVLKAAVRENLKMRDGFFVNDEAHQVKIIEALRRYRPDIVLANALSDRHPDHGRAGKLIADACFLSGLRKVETSDRGRPQEAWRPKMVFHYIQDVFREPDIIVDISDIYEQKMDAIRCYGTQFLSQGSDDPMTYISRSGFLEHVRARDFDMGHRIGVKYGEGFTCQRNIGITDLDRMIYPEFP
ncbi:MAG TPA: bacillithiol biosynthesis deacetylase BshB1 [Edaphocola sp.]|nr:bacillithiol biosynthesis deacetylase BshB1 [Edaphocola sp.]